MKKYHKSKYLRKVWCVCGRCSEKRTSAFRRAFPDIFGGSPWKIAR